MRGCLAEGESVYGVEQRSLTFLAPGTGFVEDSFSTDPAGGGGGWFRQ